MAESVSYILQIRDRFSSPIRNMNQNLNKFSDKVSKAKKNLRGFKNVQEGLSRAATRLTVGLTLPIVAGLTLMSKEAIDAQETFSKFGTVFSGVSSSAESMAKNLSDNFGLARVDAKKLLGDTGDLLTGFGFSQKSALDLANEVNKLAVDLASFTNFSGGATGASAALTKALLGERESVKSLGISILEEDVKRQVQINAAKGMRFETMRQAKAFATLIIAQNQSKNAIGDFARTQYQAANQLRIAQARLKDLRIVIGNLLVPAITKLLQRIIPAIQKASEWVRNNKQLTKTLIKVALAVAALGPILGIISTATTAMIGLRAATVAFGLSARVALGWIPLAITGLIFLETKFGLLSKSAEKLFSIFKKLKPFVSAFNKLTNVNSSEEEVVQAKEKLKSGFSKAKDLATEKARGFDFKSIFSDISSIGRLGPTGKKAKQSLATSKHRVDVGGDLTVRSQPGTVVTNAKMNNPDIGLIAANAN